jgi:hypothetical protein
MPDGVSLRSYEGPTKNLGGRPTWTPSETERRQVQIMRGCGNSLPTIARVIGVSIPTLRKACGDELRCGFEEIKALIEAAVVKRALAGDIRAAKYWLSVHCPEWRIPKGTIADRDDEVSDGERVHYYMPGDEPPEVA